MAFGRNKPQSRAEPTFIFAGGGKRDAKNADGRQEDIAFTIPAFLRTGPASARTDKTSFVDFKAAPKGERKAKAYKYHATASEPPKAQTINKNKAPVETKSANTGWFDNDFARLAETAKPKYMTEGSEGPSEPQYTYRQPEAAPVKTTKPVEAEPHYVKTPELVVPVEPVMPHVPHAATFDAASKATPEPESSDETPDSIFFFEEPEEEPDDEIVLETLSEEDEFKYHDDHIDDDEFEYRDDEDDDEHEDNPAVWQDAAYFSGDRLHIQSGDDFYTPNYARRVNHRSSFSIGSRLPLIAAVGIGLCAVTYFWPEKTPDQTASAIITREAPAPTMAQPEVDARTIVPAGPGQWARTNEKAQVDAKKALPQLRTVEVEPKAPVPKVRPTTEASESGDTPKKEVASSEPAQRRHVVLAPGPRSLSPHYSNSSSSSGISQNGPSERSRSEREEAMLSDLAVDVQRKLAVLGYSNVPQTGQLDAATRNAVRTFQLNSGLAPTGEVDSQTLRRMSNMSHIE